NRFNEAVSQGAVGVNCTPHQTLHNTVHPHRGDVQHSTDGRQPEVGVDQGDGVHLTGFTAEHDRDQVVQSTDGHHRNPAQSAGVYVADGPVSVVRQRVYSLDRHHRAFEGRHTVEGQRHHQESQDRVVTQFVPGTRQRHHTVDHTAP